MLIKPHSQATTTPKVRAAIQAGDEPARVLAERHGTQNRPPSGSGESAMASRITATDRTACKPR